ncbi:kinesin-like protein KIF20B [Osmia bicornis bicornis]|uniref:kinesin-like protein KIF20B n=1 Tax=Osmia bicornis bicornis TaxID=1437191 RepID=UPI001EAF2782|nr:kinesin-like protein KIF20B [Osmia bicornis bicornis]XP_029031953.2 kinesin-like protein KIF20B [Osmia bicornis bicornis]
MDDTLDSIRPSYDVHPREEMSYLFGRDPSILAYGQRPAPSKYTKKNLLSVYEIEESNSSSETGVFNLESHSLQTAKVYLRMKPFPKKLKLTEEQTNAYKILNSTTLFTRLPTLENNSSCLKRSNSTDIVCRKFTFTKTFGPETTQLELFEQAVKQHMVDFLAGQNSTIMTYGTTNSGKSYTLQGTTTSPGIIPRCLEFVFSNITPKSTPSYKPMNHCDVVSLNPLERAQELEIKTKLLTFASVDKHQYMNAYKEMQKLLQEESPIRPSQCIDSHYSVWVSFAEIYNEIVYDLLSNECQKKRTALKLATDSQGRAFIKGLKTVCVNSGSEAYQVLMAGQYNLKVAATALNARSSRSHCIFTIKLLKYYIENDPNSVEVSTFAFCDLAGSERLKKTLNIGERLKEAQNINTSLLVLGRCLKTIHEVQISKQKIEHTGPFRESKLTRLFQKALSGKEHIALIVNINPVPNLYIETQNVLNFSAIAKKIVIEQKEKEYKKNKSRFSQLVTQSIKTVTDWDSTQIVENEDWQNTVENDSTPDYINTEDYEELLYENAKLKKEIGALKSSVLSRDLQIRQEMADTYTAMMKELETEWKNRIKDVEEQQEDALQWSVKQVEDFYKQKLDQMSTRKRKKYLTDPENNFDDDVNDIKKINELEIENSRLTTKIVLLKNNLKEIKETNQALTVEKNKVTFELGLTKEDLKSMTNLLNAAQQEINFDEESKSYLEELKSQLFAKQEQVKKLKVFLNEAKEEYISITTEVREKEYTIKEQDEELFEKQETIKELEHELTDLNICLMEQTKTMEMLEEKLEAQTKKILDDENKIQIMQEQIDKLINEKLLLQDGVELLKKAGLTENSIKEISCKIDGSETSSDCLENEEQPSSTIEPEIVNDTLENDKKDIETVGEEEIDTQMQDKIIAINEENLRLKQKLTQSTIEIQSLKEELEHTKVKQNDIAEQIRNLQINNIKAKAETDDAKHKVAIETVEIGTQISVKSEEQGTNTIKIDLDDKSSQISEDLIKEEDEHIIKEEINEINSVEENDDQDVILDELTKLMVKYDDVKTLYKEKCLIVEETYEEILFLERKIKELSAESSTNKVVAEEYKQSIELLRQELSTMKEDKDQIKETLQSTDNIKVSLETKINDYEQRLYDTEQQLILAKNNYNQCMEKLNTLQASFDSLTTKCKNEHEEKISNLEKELSVTIEKTNLKSQCLDVHAAKIMELEQNLEGVTELKQKIDELNKKLEICQTEKDNLQKLLDENNDRLSELEERLVSAQEKEQEKDDEINSLQREMKHMIQKTENDDKSDKLMEVEMKNTIKNLTEMKEKLSRKQEYIDQLELQVKDSEQNAKILELLQLSSQERQAENERLRVMNEKLKNNLIEKEREMESFMKNRDEMVVKYECLVKNQQEELEKQKQELIKNHPKEVGYCENTSEDEVVHKERRTRRPPKKFTPTSKVDNHDIPTIDLSTSDSKRSTKRNILPPPPQVETLSETKRSTRKKKLYIKGDESFHDIEPLESTVIITPSTKTRNLRSKRKNV